MKKLLLFIGILICLCTLIIICVIDSNRTKAQVLKTNADFEYNCPSGAMYFQDSVSTLSVEANIYKRVTNAGKNLFTIQTQNNITMRGDTCIVIKSGNYDIMGFITISALTGKDFEIKIVKNGITDIVPPFKGSTEGVNNFTPIPIDCLGISLVANDKIEIQIRNITDSTDPIFRQGCFKIRKFPK